MKQSASASKIASHLFMALVIFFIISLLPIEQLWLKVTLYIVGGTYFYIDFLKLMLVGTRYSVRGAYIVFFTGCISLSVSVVWLANLIFKVIFNPLFNLLNWEFRIGNMLEGIYQYIFSVPALIVGAILIITGILWENNAQYLKWKESLFPGTQKRIFRREF